MHVLTLFQERFWNFAFRFLLFSNWAAHRGRPAGPSFGTPSPIIGKTRIPKNRWARKFECGVVPQARANAQVKTLHKRVLNSPLLGGCFFQCVCACVCLCVRVSVCVWSCPGTFQTARWPPFFIVAIDRGANSKVFDRGNFWNSIFNGPGETFLISEALFEAISRNIACRSYRKCILKLEIRKKVLQKVQKVHFWNSKP